MSGNTKKKHPNSLANLRHFSKENQPANRGRKPGSVDRPTLLKRWMDVELEIQNPITKEMMRGEINDVIILSLINEARKGNIQAISLLLDSRFGKVTDKIEHSGTIELTPAKIKELSDEELDAALEGKLLPENPL